MQPGRTPFPVWNQSAGPCPVLTPNVPLIVVRLSGFQATTAGIQAVPFIS